MHILIRQEVYVADSINCTLSYVDEKKDRLAFYPKKGVWSEAFFMFPTELIKISTGSNISYCYPQGTASIDGNGTMNIKYKGKNYSLAFVKTNLVSSEFNPLCIPFPNPNSFFVFGDYTNPDKWYVYDFGKIRWFKSDENFSQNK